MRNCLRLANRVFLPLLLVSSFPVCAGQSNPPVSPAVIYERSHSSVVIVVVLDGDAKPIGQGSGFIVAKDRVVTNHHVIEDAAGALIAFADGKSEIAEGVAADSLSRDLALLVVKTGKRPALKLGDEQSVKQGDSVYALGAPRGLELSLTNGIVSGFRDVEGQFLIQSTAAIAAGSSGGPLFDSQGRVIGVTTSSLSGSPGIYFSVAATDVSRLLRSPGIILPFAPKEPEPHAAEKPIPSVPRPAAPNPSLPETGNVAKGLYVSSRPTGADIFINGIKRREQTPAALSLPPGQYDLVLRFPGYEPYAGHIQVKENIQTMLEAELKEKPAGRIAWAQVNSTPAGAEIFIDGAPTGQVTPARVQMQAGSHIIALRLNGFLIAKRAVQASEGGTVTVKETLKSK